MVHGRTVADECIAAGLLCCDRSGRWSGAGGDGLGGLDFGRTPCEELQQRVAGFRRFGGRFVHDDGVEIVCAFDVFLFGSGEYPHTIAATTRRIC